MKFLAAIVSIGLVASEIYYQETFDTDPFADGRWVLSNWKQESGEAGKFEWGSGLWPVSEDRKGIRTTEDARFYTVAGKLTKPFDNEGKTLVFGMSVKHEQKIDCGGGYVKLLPPTADPEKFDGDSEYTIMFGPDICGYSTKRIHTIFNHKGTNLEKSEEVKCPDDEMTHTYILIVNSDDTYEVRVDNEESATGSLKDGWDFEKPKLINDPEASKPEDWVDEQYMDDPNDTKPEDWENEPETMKDPDATKPEDWDNEEDGEWEAPMIPNPNFKGEWKAQRIENPGYKGDWEHPQITNPDYVEEKEVYKRGPIGFVGIEVWQVKAGTLFSDFIIADSITDVERFFETRKVDSEKEKSAKEAYDAKNSPPPDNEDEDEEDVETHDEL